MTSRNTLPPDLHALLAEHPEGEALKALWSELPPSAPPVDSESEADAAARRDRAYARLASRLALTPRLTASSAGAENPVSTAPTLAAPTLAAPTLTATRVATVGARSRRWIGIAAALTLLIGGAAAWQATPATHSVAAGAAPRVVTLGDGSKVTLASGSTLHHARGFRTLRFTLAPARQVRLDGDAFLEIARDGRPFIVSTNDATVRVLGTRFEVRSAQSGRGTQVAVDEGRVSVHGRRTAVAAIELAAGQVGAIDGQGVPARLRDRAPERIARWRSGGLAIEDEPLSAVLKDLARRYGVEITLVDESADDGAASTDGPGAPNATVTLYYPESPTIERVLADLAAARGLHWTRTSRGYLLEEASR